MRALAQNFRAALLRGDAAQAKQSAAIMFEKSGATHAEEELSQLESRHAAPLSARRQCACSIAHGPAAAARAPRAALAAEEEAFSGYGPIPVRNFQPIQLIFLNLPFERARVQPPGHFELHLESAESNEIATNQGSIDATLKFETNRTVLGGSLGVGHGLRSRARRADDLALRRFPRSVHRQRRRSLRQLQSRAQPLPQQLVRRIQCAARRRHVSSTARTSRSTSATSG